MNEELINIFFKDIGLKDTADINNYKIAFNNWLEKSKIKNLGERSEPPHPLLSDVADLKPCPFCGSAGLLYRDNWRDNKPILKGYPSPFFVKCTNDDCDIVTLDGDNEEQVIFRWNRRV